jgi:hypothetical protein
MPDLFALAAIPSLARLRSPEIAAAVADDGDDAKTTVLGRLGAIEQQLTIDLGVIDGLDARLKLRRPLPAPAQVESLQSLVRRGRRRLQREQQGGSRQLHDVTATTIGKLRQILES